MKTHTWNWVIFMLLLLPFKSKAKELHQQIELFFANHSLSVFENDLGLQLDDYLYQNHIDKIDEVYDGFFQSIHERLEIGVLLLHSEIELEDAWLLISTKLELKPLPNLPFAGIPKLLDGLFVNMDFETGDLTGWTLIRGDVDGSAPYSFLGEFGVGPGAYHNFFCRRG